MSTATGRGRRRRPPPLADDGCGRRSQVPRIRPSAGGGTRLVRGSFSEPQRGSSHRVRGRGVSDVIQTVCASCGGVNRIAREKLSDAGTARCGRCRAPLLSGRPAPLAEEHFDTFIRRGDLPVLVDFWAPWCGPCRALTPILERAAVRLSPEVRVVKVNIDDAPSVAARLNVRAVPTLAVYRHGEEVARTSGLMEETAIVRWARDASR